MGIDTVYVKSIADALQGTCPTVDADVKVDGVCYHVSIPLHWSASLLNVSPPYWLIICYIPVLRRAWIWHVTDNFSAVDLLRIFQEIISQNVRLVVQ